VIFDQKNTFSISVWGSHIHLHTLVKVNLVLRLV